MTKLSLFAAAGLLCAYASDLSAQQAPGFLWARQANAANNGFGKSVFTDPNGYSYVTGFFDGTNGFGVNHLVSYGANDIFIARYDPQGTLLWARHAGTPNGEEGLGITADTNGNCFVTGWYNGATANFGSVQLNNFGGQDIFVAKYDPLGNLLWAVRAGGPSTDNGISIATDLNGDCYVTGVFNGSGNFSGTVLTSAGGQDVFVAKYNTAGALLWARRGGGSANDAGVGIGVDASGNCYVSGGFSSSVADFDGLTVTNSGATGFFLAKYDSSGSIQWLRSGGGDSISGAGVISWLAADQSGNSYVSGIFSGTVAFGTNTLKSAGSNDVFVAKYDTSGNLLWIHQAGGPGNESDFSGAIALDANGNCYITGAYILNATFGSVTLTNAGDHDVYVAKYDSNGMFQYAQRAGGTNYDYGRGIGVDRNGNCYLAGKFTGTAAFSPLSLTSPGNNDMFFAKLAAFNPGSPLQLSPSYSNGVASILVSGLAGQSIAVDFTPDLLAPATWTTLTNLTLSGSSSLLLDPGFTNQPRRYYRARLDP